VVFAPSSVEDVPKGFSVAFSPSVLELTVTLVICVVEPSELTLKSLKVELFRVERVIFSLRRWHLGWRPAFLLWLRPWERWS
jgi:hypothetical protein